MPIPQLEGEVVSDRDLELESLHRRISELEDELEVAKAEARRAKNIAERGVSKLKAFLTPLHQSINMIFGEMEGIVPEQEVSKVSAPQFDPRWDAWKQKLGGNTAPAKVIDALLTHGSLTRTQLRPIAEIGWSTLDAATTRLKNLSLIEKSGDRWNLKTL